MLVEIPSKGNVTSCIGYQDMKSMRNGSISTGSIVATGMPFNLLAMVILICPSYR